MSKEQEMKAQESEQHAAKVNDTAFAQNRAAILARVPKPSQSK